MAAPLIVDTHLHLYRNVEEGEAGKVGYEIWEYGPNPDVHFSDRPGDYASAVEALESSEIRPSSILLRSHRPLIHRCRLTSRHHVPCR